MHTVNVCGDSTGAVFGQVVDVPVVVRQGSGLGAMTMKVPQLQFLAKVDVLVDVQRQVLWSNQCRTLFESPQLQFLDKVIDVPVTFNDTCPWRSRQCSSWTRMLTCPCNARQVLSWSRQCSSGQVLTTGEMPQSPQFFARV